MRYHRPKAKHRRGILARVLRRMPCKITFTIIDLEDFLNAPISESRLHPGGSR